MAPQRSVFGVNELFDGSLRDQRQSDRSPRFRGLKQEARLRSTYRSGKERNALSARNKRRPVTGKATAIPYSGHPLPNAWPVTASARATAPDLDHEPAPLVGRCQQPRIPAEPRPSGLPVGKNTGDRTLLARTRLPPEPAYVSRRKAHSDVGLLLHSRGDGDRKRVV